VYCRTKWDDGKPAGKGKGIEETDEDGYLNLGKLVGASSSRGMDLNLYRTKCQIPVLITITTGVRGVASVDVGVSS
jgi:hypothetical protein